MEDRVKYVISNSRICSPNTQWQWDPYTGSNPHDHHVHVSVEHPSSLFDDPHPWGWGEGDDMAYTEDQIKDMVTAAVWGVEWGRSGQTAMQWIDQLDTATAGAAWSIRPWSSEDPKSTASALQQLHGMVKQLQADMAELKAALE